MSVYLAPELFCGSELLPCPSPPECAEHGRGGEQMGIRLKRWVASNYLMSKRISLICLFGALVRLSGENRLRGQAVILARSLLLSHFYLCISTPLHPNVCTAVEDT